MYNMTRMGQIPYSVLNHRRMTELQHKLKMAVQKKELVSMISSLRSLVFLRFCREGLPDIENAWLKSPIVSINTTIKPIIDATRGELEEIDMQVVENKFFSHILLCCGLNYHYEWAELKIVEHGWLKSLFFQNHDFIIMHPSNFYCIYINGWENKRLLYEDNL